MIDLPGRSALVARLQGLDALPARVSEVLYARHPAWLARFGEPGRRRCVEDVKYHLSFLAGAAQAGSADIFGQYVDWAAAVLAVHHVPREHFAECLEVLTEQLESELPGVDARYLVSLLKAGGARLTRAASPGEAAPHPHTPACLAYVAAALTGRRAQAYGVVREALEGGWAISDVYREMLLAGQRRTGELWASGEISVAQEHLASAITQWVMARLYSEATTPGAPLGRVLVGGAEGELHSLPAHFASDLLELEGWDVVFLGTHVPIPAFLSSIEKHEPSIVGVSAMMTFNLPASVALVRAVRERFPALRVVVGGRAFQGAGDLAAELGAEHDPRGDLAPFRAA